MSDIAPEQPHPIQAAMVTQIEPPLAGDARDEFHVEADASAGEIEFEVASMDIDRLVTEGTSQVAAEVAATREPAEKPVDERHIEIARRLVNHLKIIEEGDIQAAMQLIEKIKRTQKVRRGYEALIAVAEANDASDDFELDTKLSAVAAAGELPAGEAIAKARRRPAKKPADTAQPPSEKKNG